MPSQYVFEMNDMALVPCTSTELPALTRPLFGRTQYLKKLACHHSTNRRIILLGRCCLDLYIVMLEGGMYL